MPRHISDCDDTAVMLKALTDPDDPIDIKAAGTAMRFLTAYFAVKEGERKESTGMDADAPMLCIKPKQ